MKKHKKQKETIVEIVSLCVVKTVDKNRTHNPPKYRITVRREPVDKRICENIETQSLQEALRLFSIRM